MRKIQNDRLNMLVTTAAFEAAHDPVILALIPQLHEKFTGLELTIADIRQAAAEQTQYKAAVSLGRNAAGFALQTIMLDGVGILSAYGVLTNDDDLTKRFRITEARIRRLKNNKLLAESTAVLSAMTEREADLAPYGVDKKSLTDFYEAIETYRTLMARPRENKVNLSDTTRKLSALFRSVSKILKTLDVLVEMLRTRHPEIYDDYKSRRIVVSSPTRGITLKGRVTDTAGKRLQKVKVTIDGLPNTATSGKTGYFRFMTLPDGVHILRFSRPGYQDLLHTIAISRGMRHSAIVELREI